jgi:NAD(P)-dependent dehydrogenase (short-subunit alcohol dehydrogenase family)
MVEARDWRVILGSRDRAKAHGLVPGADVRALDLGDAASIAALASALAGEGITLDALVNNAAISMRGFDAHVAERTLAINLLGTRCRPRWVGSALCGGGSHMNHCALTSSARRARGRRDDQRPATVGWDPFPRLVRQQCAERRWRRPTRSHLYAS